MQLQLVVADFHLDAAELAGDAVQGLPRLPALEQWLRRGSASRDTEDWRAVSARIAGRPELVGLPPAQIAALALGDAAPANPWLAAPVHLAAGLDHLRLHPAGLLHLEQRELQALAVEFAQVFAGSGLALLPLQGGFVLAGLMAQHAQTRDPADFLGADIRNAPPRGADAQALRRLGAELEMWLHGSAVNTARERRGQLAISSLWLWGGGAMPAGVALRPKALSLPAAWSDDAYMAGLWHASGAEARALPPDLQPVLASAVASAVVVLSAATRGPRDQPLPRLDNDWLAPAVAALRTGQVSTLHLHCDGLHCRLRAADRLRFWRRLRPWWERLST
jgi:hypothetical protein